MENPIANSWKVEVFIKSHNLQSQFSDAFNENFALSATTNSKLYGPSFEAHPLQFIHLKLIFFENLRLRLNASYKFEASSSQLHETYTVNHFHPMISNPNEWARPSLKGAFDHLRVS